MPSKRVRQAAKDLDKINQETDIELRELNEAINEVETLHEEHVEEMELDKIFIEDLKKLFKEIKAVRQIEHHMRQEVEEYGRGNMSQKEFKQRFVNDEEKFVQVVKEIRTELEEMIRVLSQEERLTNKDLDIEGATENLVRELSHEEGKLEETHEHIEELVIE